MTEQSYDLVNLNDKRVRDRINGPFDSEVCETYRIASERARTNGEFQTLTEDELSLYLQNIKVMHPDLDVEKLRRYAVDCAGVTSSKDNTFTYAAIGIGVLLLGGIFYYKSK